MKISRYSLKEIESKYKEEENVRVKERLQIILHLREGYTQRDVSSLLRLSVGKVPYWQKRFELEGFSGLYDKDGRGRKAELTGEELSMFASALADGYLMENGYTRPYKTKDAVKFLSENFEINYTIRHVRRLLTTMGLRLKVPRPRHKKRNKEDVDKFKRQFKKNFKN
jgi:putative transposase